jgi:hypothetical protein
LTSGADVLDLRQYTARESGPLRALVGGDAQIVLELPQTFLGEVDRIRLGAAATTR